jgi:acyl-CoA hydrolase
VPQPELSAQPADKVVDQIRPGDDLIVPIANGEPVTLLDALEADAERLDRVRIHQMHVLHDRPYLHGALRPNLSHVSYFLSHVTREAFHDDGLDLVPSHFSEVPALIREHSSPAMVLASVSPPDRHGFVSLGTAADYTASFIGQLPFYVEVNAQMPRSQGRNQVHVSQITGMTEADYPLVEVTPVEPTDVDLRIAGFVAERISSGTTVQAGIGAIPNAILSLLVDHQHLGLHTELLSDGVMHLMESGALTGARKTINPCKLVATFALGTRELYDFIDDNPAVELWPVDYVNDPRVIGQERCFVSINATLAVDLLGQCASETLQGRYYSGSGGQADFARGAMYSPEGQGFVVLHSTTRDEKISRIVPQLGAGEVVTTPKNTVDKIVTEWGVAELRGRSIRQRARALIAIAHPDHRDTLQHQAERLGFL